MLLGLFGGQYIHKELLLSQPLTPSLKHKYRNRIWRKGELFAIFACVNVGHNPKNIEVNLETTLVSLDFLSIL